MRIPLSLSVQSYIVPEGTTDLVVPFPYTRREYIHVYKGHTIQNSHKVPAGTVELKFTWIDDARIRLDEPVQGAIQVTRKTCIKDTWECNDVELR